MEQYHECPRWFNISATASSLLLFITLFLLAWLNPDYLMRLARIDSADGGAGLLEYLTPIVLIPGILCGLYAFFRYRERMPHTLLGYWVLAWSLACFYFAGEEISWGQWFFGWESGDFMAKVNRQGETNLHNISPWLNQNPRAIVELFIFTAGFLLPLRQAMGNAKSLFRRGFASTCENWIIAPSALIMGGLMVMIIRVAHWLPKSAFAVIGDSEVREFVIAWFLMWYLISYPVRLKNIPGVVKSKA